MILFILQCDVDKQVLDEIDRYIANADMKATHDEDQACIDMLVAAERRLHMVVANTHFKMYQLNSRLLSSYILVGN